MSGEHVSNIEGGFKISAASQHASASAPAIKRHF